MNSVAAWVFSDPKTPMKFHSSVDLSSLSLQEGELLLRLEKSCVCGSDIHTYLGKRSDPAAPLVLGHEGIGTVVLSAREGVSVGVLVTWALAVPQCTSMEPRVQCESCQTFHLPQKCSRVLKYGHAPWSRAASPGPREFAEGLSGCFASHVLLRTGTYIIPLTEALAAGVPADALASVNCAGGTAMACWRTAQRHLLASTRGTMSSTTAPRRVLIFGAGLLGLYLAAAARRDCGKDGIVCVVDISKERLHLATAFGASHTVLFSPSDLTLDGIVAAIGAAAAPVLPSGLLFDAVFEVCGQPSVVAPGVRLMRPGGVVILAGMVHPASDLGSLTGEAVIRKCGALVGVHNYEGEDLREAVGLLRHAHQNFESVDTWKLLFSPAFALKDLPQAMELASKGVWARVVLSPHS